MTLRPLAPDDAPAYAAIRYHPEVVKWMLPAPTEKPCQNSRRIAIA